MKVTLGSPVALATTVLAPTVEPSVHDVTVATPLALVVTGDPTTAPPPAVTAKVTATPPIPGEVADHHARRIGHVGPAAADCAVAELATIDTARVPDRRWR